MTIQRLDGKECTKFSDWTRKVERLDSKEEGFWHTDIDSVWYCNQGIHSAGKWLIIETKNKMGEVKGWQDQLLRKVARACQAGDPDFKGLVYLQFENTGPEDGKIFWNSVEITTEQLIEFLSFKKEAPAKTCFVRKYPKYPINPQPQELRK